MKKHLLPYFITFLLFSCGQNNNQTTSPPPPNPTLDSIAVVNNPKSYLNIQTNHFFEIDTSGVLMFPLELKESDRESDSFNFSEYSKSSSEGAYWNVVFYDTKTKDYHLLSEQKMAISNYDYSYSSSGVNNSHGNFSQTKKYIFYTIRTDDLNHDNKLDAHDPLYLFVSDKFGKNFRQLSPKNYSLNQWQFVEKTNKIILTASQDSDKNAKFNNADEATVFEIEPDKGADANEVLKNDFKNKLKVLFDRDWKGGK